MRGRGMKFHMGGVMGDGRVFVAIVEKGGESDGPGTSESTYDCGWLKE